VQHPAGKLFVQLAEAQEREVGDGTTSVVLLGAELLAAMLRQAQHCPDPFFCHLTFMACSLLERGIPPPQLARSLKEMLPSLLEDLEELSFEQQEPEVPSTPEEGPPPRGSLHRLAAVSLCTKYGGHWGDHMAQIAVDTVQAPQPPPPPGPTLAGMGGYGRLGVAGRLGWVKSLGGSPGDSKFLPGAGLLSPGVGWRGESLHRSPASGFVTRGLVVRSLTGGRGETNPKSLYRTAKELAGRGYGLVVVQEGLSREALGALAHGGLIAISGCPLSQAQRAAAELGTPFTVHC